jgi:hypothetical protein
MSEKKQPFFAKFLEEDKVDDLNPIKGGVTMKYPSDDDEVTG